MRLTAFGILWWVLFLGPVLSQERTYAIQNLSLNELNIIARALESGRLGDGFMVYLKIQQQISQQDQAAAQAARAAIEKDVRGKVESEGH